MARKKRISPASQSQSSGSGILDYFRFGDSYTSLILGMVVVILAVILLTAFFKNRNFSNLLNRQPKQDISATKTEPKANEIGGVYTVQAGESLWQIAEKTYKSGYNWVDIAKANNITSPDTIEANTQLTLPNVQAKETTLQAAAEQPQTSNEQIQNPNAITGTTYTVAQGDYLWDIAVRAYNDGYRWVEIARDNNIQRPDIIYSGTVLRLKR